MVGRIEGQGDVTRLGELLGIQARDLLLHAAVGVGDHRGRISLPGIVASRRVHVGHRREIAVRVLNGVDVDPPFDVLGQRAFVDEAERVAVERYEIALGICSIGHGRSFP